jgi:signal transduction histidine kinase
VCSSDLVENFSLGDGLPPVSTSYGASMVDRAGRIWVATYHGAAVFDPALELPPPPVSELRLDGIQVAGRPRAEREGLGFKYTERPLLFEYSLTGHYRDEEVQYRTQLLGEEKEPAPWTTEGRRELTALSGGHYTLRVWARDYLGRISGPLDIPLRIHPPPWASPWAYLAYGLAVAGVLFLAYRLRLRLLHERNRLLQARVREATATLDAQRRELERMNEDKNRFMGLAAHDLRSPLNSIMLSAEALLDGPSRVTDYGRCVHRIQRAASQMNDLIGNLVQTNQIESGFLSLVPALYDLRALAADAHQRFQDQARAKGIRLEFSTPWEDIPVWVDSSYLHQVLDNLLSNAIKFTPPGPPERPVHLRLSRNGPQALIEVQDQGPGLGPEDMAKVFGRFARLSARPTAGEGSTGLGLSIVKSLVEGMKGRVSVESELGKGATFRVAFPLADPGSAPPDRQQV